MEWDRSGLYCQPWATATGSVLVPMASQAHWWCLCNHCHCQRRETDISHCVINARVNNLCYNSQRYASTNQTVSYQPSAKAWSTSFSNTVSVNRSHLQAVLLKARCPKSMSAAKFSGGPGILNCIRLICFHSNYWPNISSAQEDRCHVPVWSTRNRQKQILEV